MILVTGAAGHTGLHVVKRLQQRYPSTPIRCLVRPTTTLNEIAKLGVDLVRGDLFRAADLRQAAVGARVIVHIANIRCSPGVVEAALEAGTEQVVLVHTTGVYSKYRAYAGEYQRIEQDVLARLNGTRCHYTIIRPTMIYGGWQDHNLHKLITVLNRTPFFPVFGNGQGKMQPVHVEDLADSIVNAVDNMGAFNTAFNVSGASVHTYKEILRMVTGLLGRKVLILHVPYGLSLALISLLNLMRISPVSVEQVRRLAEDKVFDHSFAAERLGYRPRPLEAGLKQQITEMGIRSSLGGHKL